MGQWYNINLAAGVTYPYVVIIVNVDSSGNVDFVDINKMTGENSASGEWSQLTVPAGTATVTATGVTFNNLTAPGYGASPGTSLVLNGTLRFDPQ